MTKAKSATDQQSKGGAIAAQMKAGGEASAPAAGAGGALPTGTVAGFPGLDANGLKPLLFPILGGIRRKVKFVEWKIAERFRKAIEEAHGQSLEGVARLGGLDAHEFACLIDPEQFKPGRRRNAPDADGFLLDYIGGDE